MNTENRRRSHPLGLSLIGNNLDNLNTICQNAKRHKFKIRNGNFGHFRDTQNFKEVQMSHHKKLLRISFGRTAVR